MAGIDLTGKQYNIVVNLVGYSSDMGNRIALIEEMVAEYTNASPPIDDSVLNGQDAIKHLDGNSVAVWVNAWNALVATAEWQAFRAEMLKAAP